MKMGRCCLMALEWWVSGLMAKAEDDPAAVVYWVQEWKEAWPQARVRELAGVGHLPISEGTREEADAVFSSRKLQQ